MKITVIVGPPVAGKSSYAWSNAADGDVVVDYDRIAQALGSKVPHGATGAVQQVAQSARLSAIFRILHGVDGPAWTLHTNPNTEQINEYVDAGASFILIDPGKDACIERAHADGRPPETIAAIEVWYANPPKLPEGTTTVKQQTLKGPNMPAEQNSLPVTVGFLRGALRIIAEGVGNTIAKKNASLESRIAALENEPRLKYCGVFRDGEKYVPGNFCTRGGSVFHCNRATTDAPGSSDAWVLAVKAGRDAR